MLMFNSLIDGEWLSTAPARPNVNPSNTNDIVGEAARGDARAGRGRDRGGEGRIPGVVAVDAAGPLRHPEEGVRRNPGPQGRARPAAVARGRQDACRKASARRCAPAQIFAFFAGECAAAGRREAALPCAPASTSRSRAKPLGVVGMITPWNFPIAIPAWKIAPALGLRQHRRVQAGRPRARLAMGAGRYPAPRRPARRACSTSCIGRGSVVGAASCSNIPTSTRSRFTGSVATGQKRRGGLRRVAPMKKFQLEMGGKNPLVVLDDADLEDRGRMRRQRRVLLDRPALHGVVAADRHQQASTTDSSTR